MGTVKRDSRPTAARPTQRGPRRAAPAAAPAIDAAADVDRVVDAYCTLLLEKGYDDPMYWWWPRAVWVDPNQLIVDGENGSLYRVGFSTSDDQEVTFADPVEVLETFTDMEPAAKARVLATAGRETGNRGPVRVFAAREDTPAPPKAEGEGGVPGGGNNVGMNREQLCAALGLPADATDEQIDAKTAELAAEQDTGGEGGTGTGDGGAPEGGEGAGGDGGGEGAGGDGGGEGAPAGGDGGEGGGDAAPAAGALPDGMVAVPAEVWEDVQANATAGGALAEQAETTNRDNTIAAATGAGKIAPHAKESMVNLHARDKQAFYTLLTASVSEGGLAPNLIPVSQRGSASPSAGAQQGPAAAGGGPGAITPGGQVPAEAGGEYVPPERMVALFGAAYVPPTPDQNGMTVIGAGV